MELRKPFFLSQDSMLNNVEISATLYLATSTVVKMPQTLQTFTLKNTIWKFDDKNNKTQNFIFTLHSIDTNAPEKFPVCIWRTCLQ